MTKVKPTYQALEEEISKLKMEIEDLKHSESYEKLKQTELLLKSSLESPQDLIILSVDADYNYLYFNNVHKEGMKAGYGIDIEVGMNILECVTSAEDRRNTKYNYDLALSGTSHSRVLAYGDIPKTYFETFNSPIYDDHGVIIGVSVFAREITERIQAEEALKVEKERAEESEKRFKTIFDDAPIGVAIVDSNTGYILEVNRKFAQIAGRTIEETKKIDWMSVTHPDDIEKGWHNTALMNEGKIDGFNIETRISRPEGTIVWLSMTCVPLINDGESKQHLTIAEDITSRKQNAIELINANENVEKSEKRFRSIFNDAPIGIAIIDAYSGQILEVNQEFTIITGYTEQEAKNIVWMSITYPDDIQINMDKINQLNNGEINVANVENRVIHSEGRILWINFTCVPFIKEKENRQHLVILEDVTSRIQNARDLITAKEQVEESEKQFRTIFNETPIGISLVDSNTGYIYEVNPTFAKISGRTIEEAKNINWMSITHPDDIQADLDNMAKFNRGEITGFQMEKRYILPSGDFVWILLTVVPFINTNESKRHLAITEDITKRKMDAIELIAAKDKAEESDRLKTTFLANMSHEIRTPMNGILGFANLLKDPDHSVEEQQEFIRIIEKSGTRMLNIINNIVDISKIEAGVMVTNLEETNVSDLIDHIYNFFKPEVEEKGMQISSKNAISNKASIIITDREKLFAVLTNLVKNAIKYSEAGRIEFGYSKKGKYLEFFVNDIGRGIDEAKQKVIFERFIQAEAMDKQLNEGAGLGLAISKGFVELLGGEIWVESEINKGSTFYFTIPYVTETSQNKEIVDLINDKKKGNNVSSLKILVAEDDEFSFLLVYTELTKLNHTLIRAKTGREAIDIIRNNPDIDLILMDIQMPEMDGYEATHAIRQFNNSVIIIAQTAFGLESHRKEAISVGCNGYLSKPIVINELIALLNEHFT